MLKWEKLGQVFDPTKVKGRPWLSEFAQCTSTLVMDDVVRVYFSCRPARNVHGLYTSNTTFLDLDRDDLARVVRIADKPLLPLGGLGCFDEFGIYPTSVVPIGDQVYFYYAGWTRPTSVFADLSIGVAVSNDGEDFKRLGEGPVLTKSLQEPFQLSGPKVRRFNGKLYMFYIAGEHWMLTENGKSETFYKIRVAISDDGLAWVKHGENLLDPVLDNECQAGPDVFEYGGVYHMYFSYRYGLDFRGNDRGYRIGYARSTDLLSWQRFDDEAGIGLSAEGWDSKDMHYPHVFELDGELYMLYNGNEFGRFGFGLAVLQR